jgi:predicted phage baseplate assembly protein
MGRAPRGGVDAVDVRTDLDCAATPDCPPPAAAPVEIDYLAKDYPSFRQLLLDRLALTVPTWTERHAADLGVALVELLAYEGDRLSYRQDAVATEAYLDTARLRVSVRRHTRLVDYPMHDGCAARAWVCLSSADEVRLPAGTYRFVTLPPGTPAGSGPVLREEDLADPGLPAYEVFEPVHREDIVLRPAHGEIPLWTGGDADFCLAAGATAATLVDGEPPHRHHHGGGQHRALRLVPGDVLVFEEVRGAVTGAVADADHSHTQAVRLTAVTETVDDRTGQPLLEVSWAARDALAFPFRVSARGGPDCVELVIGVARGNAVLVEHGRGLAPEPVPVPAAPPTERGCPDPVDFGCPEPGAVDRPGYPPLPLRIRPRLAQAPVTRSAPYPAPADVARAQAQRLLGVPGRARQRIARIIDGLEHRLRPADRAYLLALFGPAVLRRLRLDEHPARALPALLARFDDLLTARLDRLAVLLRRARAGYVLGADIAWELAQTWGQPEGDAIAPDQPALRGPAVAATRPDPRAALPDVTVTDRLGRLWLPRRDLLGSAATDRHFVAEVDDAGFSTLRFGDDRTGAAFPAGGELLAHYRVGLGRAGNVGREAIGRIVLHGVDQDAIQAVRNPMPAAGGVDAEPVAEVRARAPREMRQRLLRAITPADYAALAGQTAGVQRAAADLRWTGSWYEAQVAVDPVGAEVAPDQLLDEVRQALHRYRRIGHDLSVVSAELVPLDLALAVQVEAGHVTGHVRAALLRVFAALFAPDQLTFGTPIRVSRLVAAAASVTGVQQVAVTRLERLFGGPSDALATGVLPIGPLEVAQLDNDPTHPERGLLTLDLGGGR